MYLADLRGGQGLMQRVAVKILHSGNPDEPEVSARQRDEARLLAQLNHDHIVKVYDLIEVEGRPAVIMEYIDGVDAETWVKRGGPMPPRSALQVIAGVASALDAAYNTESPVTGRPLCAIHRDVKPANVLISVHGAVKVLDFGVARADLDRDAETRDAQAMGTLAFIAPEQWMLGSVTSAVDIYALGLTLLRLLTGQVVERIPLSAERYAARVAELTAMLNVPDWPEQWRTELQQLVGSMLAWDAANRPLPRDVEGRCLTLADGAPGEGLAVLARRQVPNLVEERRRYGQTSIILPGDVTMTLTSVSPSTAPTLAPRQPAPQPKRNPMRLILGAAFGGLMVGLVLVAAGIWLALREPSPIPTAAATTATSSGGPAVVNEVRRRKPEAAAGEASPTPAATVAKTSASTAKAAPEKASTEKPQDNAKTSAAALPSWPLTVSSVPLGAQLMVDGKSVGATPARGLTLTEGEHTLKVVASDGRSSEKTIRVSEHAPSRYIWRADTDAWESGL